jgi:protein gp37
MPQWNPWHGCHKISAGCQNCYVYRIDSSFEKDASIISKTMNFNLPLKKTRKGEYKLPAGETVYTCFSSDFFLEEVDEWRNETWQMIRLRSDLHFFIITKRIDRFEVNPPLDWGDGYNNVTIGSTCETQDRANFRLPILLSLSIKHKVIICEPLLEHIDISRWLSPSIEEVIVGGESGENARVCNFDWVLDIRNQCMEKKVPFHFKQTGAKFLKNGRLYTINRRYQHSQAAKAGIDFSIF